MRVSLLLSVKSWVQPRGEHGMRHHVRALYEEVFRGEAIRLYPSTDRSLLRNGMAHVPPALAADVNVIAPGYPVVTAAMALRLKKRLGLVVHTWKVPGHSDERLTARGYDALLMNVISHASAVVVASEMQQEQMRNLGVRAPVYFSPVTVDARYWYPGDVAGAMDHFGLSPDEYVFTVGGNDRDELYGARLARELGITYVRAGNHAGQLNIARRELEQAGLTAHTRFLSSPSDAHLRALYRGARVVCLPTITRTNPAGLSALVEAMACGALVAVPRALAGGYVTEGESGLVLTDDFRSFAERLGSSDRQALRARARASAEVDLDVTVAASRLASLRRDVMN